MIHSPDPRTKSDKASSFNVFGRYRLIADVGRGGMSDVYLAVTEGTEAAARFQKLLVIKMLKPELSEDSEFVAMFLNEARLAARLNHPNVVQTIEVGEAGGRYFLAMEYLEGQPLHRVLRHTDVRARLGLDMRLHMLIQALAGLHYAHERRDYDGSPLDIVHRDVSPANLFVTYDGHVKLMDFGIAKARDSNSETRVGVFKGKAAYVAPEQARGETVDRRADVYSVGVVLWELLTGRRLWSGLTQIEMLRRVVAGDVTTPRSVDPRIPAELEEICMKALAFSREDRYATAAELATDLEYFAQRTFPPVAERDIGSAVAAAFTEDRDRIRDVVESSLSHHPTPDSSLPAPNLVDMAKSAAPGDSSDENSVGREALPITETMSREPVVSTSGTGSAQIQRPSKIGKGVGIGAVLLIALASGLAGFGYYLKKPAPAAVATPAPAPVLPVERGVSEREIKIGMSAVFSGPSRDLGQNMKLGVETSFQAANEAGGVNGRMLTLTALDDGYEATRAAVTMKDLLDERGVFAVVGNVGTPTSVVAAPFAAQRKAIFFGAFTGASVLRQDPPERYVFNYRASYKEETAKSIKYLIEVGKLKPEEIVVFAQEDSFGDAGYEGVAKAMRGFGHLAVDTLRVGYKRNTADVEAAVAAVAKYNDEVEKSEGPHGEVVRTKKHAVKAVVMVATYRAAAKFIQKLRAVPALSGTLFFNVSFVGSESLAEELANISPALCSNVYVTQVVPLFDSGATGVRRYREQLAKFQPQAQPGFVSLEGYIVGSIFVEALRRVGPALTTEKLVDTLEQIDGLDLGFGTKIAYSLSEHQGSHKVWGTKLDVSCTYKVVDLD